jgi:hypothetical protein
MPASDGRHLDDLALDQLDALPGAQNAGLGHPVILVDRETPPGQGHEHVRTSIPCAPGNVLWRRNLTLIEWLGRLHGQLGKHTFKME